MSASIQTAGVSFKAERPKNKIIRTTGFVIGDAAMTIFKVILGSVGVGARVLAFVFVEMM